MLVDGYRGISVSGGAVVDGTWLLSMEARVIVVHVKDMADGAYIASLDRGSRYI
jgi:hypothetical protein